MKQLSSSFPAELDARVARFGLRVAAALSESQAQLPRDVSERLRFAREQALLKAREARAASVAPAAAGGWVGIGSSLTLTGGDDQRQAWPKWLSMLPLALLLAGLLLAQRGQVHDQIQATAEVDTALLRDHLPTTAYTDPGFAEFLRTEQE
jgi:hypothetical protein